MFNRSKVYYQEAGTGEPLLILHGWGASSETMKSLFIHFAKHGRCVKVLDFPGFGLSEPPPAVWGTDEYTEMVLAFLSEWGWKRTDIIAHSFGARVAVKLAVAGDGTKAGKLLLTGAAGIKRKSSIPLYKTIISKVGKVAGLFGPPGKWVKDALYSVIGSADYLSAGSMRSVLVKVVNENIESLYPAVKNETLLIWGEDDSATPLEDGRKMHSLLPNSKLETIPSAGHYAFAEKPEQFISMADRFFGTKK